MRKPLLDKRSNCFGDGDYGLERLTPTSDAFVEELVEEALHQVTRDTKADIWRRRQKYVRSSRKEQKKFESRLHRRWGSAFELFDLCRLLAFQIGEEINSEGTPLAEAQNDLTFWVLVRLHARACLVLSEVRSLLMSGHASGAHARWRSLHEIAVVSSFIQEHGQEVAERYVSHDAIQVAKSARMYQASCERLGQEPHEPNVLHRLEQQRVELIGRFGKGFGEEWGWAAATLGVGKPSFALIEAATQRDHWKPYYRLASFSIHPQMQSLRADLGNSYPDEKLLAGPSNVGLTDPAHGSLIAMLQITAGLGVAYATEKSAVLLPILLDLTDDAGGAFLTIEQEIEREEAEIRREAQSPKDAAPSASDVATLSTD